MSRPSLAQLILNPPSNREGFVWATITSISPATVLLPGDTAGIPVSAIAVATPLRVGQRVYCVWAGGQLTIIGTAPETTAPARNASLATITHTSPTRIIWDDETTPIPVTEQVSTVPAQVGLRAWCEPTATGARILHIYQDTGWVTLTAASGWTAHVSPAYRVKDGWVSFRGSLRKDSAPTNSYTTATTIPAAYAPAVTYRRTSLNHGYASTSSAGLVVSVDTDGRIRVAQDGTGAGKNVYLSAIPPYPLG